MQTEYGAVVSGSFNEATIPIIQSAVRRLHELGYHVLAPIFGEANDLSADFVTLDTDDRTKSPKELEADYLAAIGNAALHIIVPNPNTGRIGRSAAAEYAYAAIHGIARAVLAPQASAAGKLNIWFSDDLSPEERQALDSLPRMQVDLSESASAALEGHIRQTQPLSTDHHDFGVLSGIYERLLADLPDTPIQY